MATAVKKKSKFGGIKLSDFEIDETATVTKAECGCENRQIRPRTRQVSGNRATPTCATEVWQTCEGSSVEKGESFQHMVLEPLDTAGPQITFPLALVRKKMGSWPRPHFSRVCMGFSGDPGFPLHPKDVRWGELELECLQ